MPYILLFFFLARIQHVRVTGLPLVNFIVTGQGASKDRKLKYVRRDIFDYGKNVVTFIAY